MTHDKILQIGTSSSYQHCFGIDKKRRLLIKCSNSIGETIWYLQAPSIPLCARSGTDWKTGSGSGYKDCLYSEVIQEPYPSSSKICKDNRAKLERDNNPSAGSLFEKRSEAWLRGGKAPERSSWNTAMTGCHLKRSCKLMCFWSLKKFGSRFIRMNV